MGQAKRRGDFLQRRELAVERKIAEAVRDSMSVEEFLNAMPSESQTAFNKLKQIVEQHAPSIPLRIPSSKIWE